MKLKLSLAMCSALWLGALLTTTSPSPARGQDGQLASESRIAAIELPDGAMRLPEREMPDAVRKGLKTLIAAADPRIVRGEDEVLVWMSNARKTARLKELKAQVKQRLESAGWTYQETPPLPQASGSTPIFAVRVGETRKGLVGLWTPTDARIFLSWTEMLPGNTGIVPPNQGEPTPPVQPADDTPGNDTPGDATPQTGPETPPLPYPPNSLLIDVSPNQKVVNVMKAAMPTLPPFGKIVPKKGYVRGYVKDIKGKPLAGAKIGVRSSATGGFYSGAQGKTDANGYYEIEVPWGAAEFYCAGYTVDWGESRAALGLHPANGSVEQFASAVGYVQNWVLLPYGIANRDAIVDQPQYINNYYGGSVNISYFVSDPRFGNDGGLPEGSRIEVILIPKGPLFDGSKGKPFVFHQTVVDGIARGFKVVNLPLGEYSIKATLRGNGRAIALKMKEAGRSQAKPLGLEPKEGRGAATITFRPLGALADRVPAGHGNWDTLDVLLQP